MWHDYSVCLDLASSEIREIWVGVRFSRDCGKPHTHMRRREGARSLRDGARWNGLDGRKFWMGRVGGRELVRGRPCAECRAGQGARWVFLSRGFLLTHRGKVGSRFRELRNHSYRRRASGSEARKIILILRRAAGAPPAPCGFASRRRARGGYARRRREIVALLQHVTRLTV